MKLFKNKEFWVGCTIWLLLGFLASVLTTGVGYLIALVFYNSQLVVYHFWYIARYGCCVLTSSVFA